MHINNELGTINDLESGNINCEECRSKSVKRLYNFTGMNKALSHEERIEEIEKEVKDTIKKVPTETKIQIFHGTQNKQFIHSYLGKIYK